MIAEAFQSGEEQARRDIAAGKLRLHHQLRGDWGRDLPETLRTRFGVEIIELTCFTTEQESSYEAGYDAVVASHIDSVFGRGAVAAAYEEVHTRRKNRHDSGLPQTKAEPPDMNAAANGGGPSRLQPGKQNNINNERSRDQRLPPSL